MENQKYGGNCAPAGASGRDARDGAKSDDREYRDKVRESVERVRSQNREILNRLATK